MARPIYYKTNFKLEHPVVDYYAARDYLLDDDMTKYLVDELHYNKVKEEEIAKVQSIEWHLRDEQSGYILLTTTDVLPNNILNMISTWVSGQNSDGLGESFEQQDFAVYDEDDCYDMASFDWQTNKYQFKRVSSPYSITESYNTGEIYYRTNFRLTRSVTNVKAAQEYLTEDDMTEYLLDDLNSNVNISIKDAATKVTNITWILETSRSGYILLAANDYLSDEVLDYISEWVSGQNSDGLGEGFEQQYFAMSKSGRAYASFDWETNDYKFKLDKNTSVRENNKYKTNMIRIKRIDEMNSRGKYSWHIFRATPERGDEEELYTSYDEGQDPIVDTPEEALEDAIRFINFYNDEFRRGFYSIEVFDEIDPDFVMGEELDNGKLTNLNGLNLKFNR